ncbi:conserved hypothetical protein; putative TonB box [Herminiimonas arsenicoxydans]|uniref:Uncharacterized protein n=1 Tax=Herminiimonas arsenicoxydans TaxID=204773 RepID=A4G2K1_HERAR|nr:conserved hypothetical protein; putative TonB box [Herminiimonas arsenicoxydans]
MLVIFTFMINVGIWSDHSNWLTHELEHGPAANSITVAGNYLALHDIEIAEASNATSEMVVEHELLHAADHLQLFLTINATTIFLTSPRISETHFNSLTTPPSVTEKPFRPPRFFT